jgi:aconitase A
MMLAHARPLRHERRPVPGGGVLRRGGAGAVDAERMTLANMSAELGAQVGLVAPDATTRDWLAPRVRHRRTRHSCAGTATRRAGHLTIHFRCVTLAPQVAVPHSPANVRAVGDLDPRASRSPTSAPAPVPSSTTCARRLRVLAGFKVAAGVQLLVAPASLHDRERPKREGILPTCCAAGATLLPAACGACAGYGSSIPEGSTVISSTARNFKGRMGAATRRRSTWARRTRWRPRRCAAALPTRGDGIPAVTPDRPAGPRWIGRSGNSATTSTPMCWPPGPR